MIRNANQIGQFQDIRELLDELRHGFEKGDLSEIQWRVLEMKLTWQTDGPQFVQKSNIEVIRKLLGHGDEVSCNKALMHCIIRGIHGRKWEPGMKGGRNVYFGESDQRLFEDNIKKEVQFFRTSSPNS
jgi:hypothetical protein